MGKDAERLLKSAKGERAELAKMLAFLAAEPPHHLADEEIDIFQLTLKRCDAEVEIDKVIAGCRSNQGHAEADAPASIAIIKGIGESPSRPFASDGEQMAEFAHHTDRHLILENAIVLPFARARLTQEDLNTMKRHMLERRGSLPPTGE